jgi:transmembrane sensor
MDPILFQKYLDGDCDAAELKAVEEWIYAADEESWEVLMKARWTDAGEEMPVKMRKRLWRKLRKEAIGNENGLVYTMMQWTVAACCIGLILLVMQPSAPVAVDKKDRHTVRNTGSSGADEWLLIKNKSSTQKKIFMSDGTIVMLYPGTSIHYQKNYGVSTRDIRLEGKADFDVAKDKRKPFTVFAGNSSTTALGTRFEIDNRSHLYVNVKLYEGLILVRKFSSDRKEILSRLLHPGETLHLDTGNLPQPAEKMKTLASPDILTQKTADEKLQQLEFVNTPLAEALEKIGAYFHIQIVFDATDLGGMTLTTNINRQDKPDSILLLIAKINELDIVEEAGRFIVKKR